MEYLEKIKEKIMTTRVLGIIGVILLAIGNFLPIATYRSQTISYIEGDGIFILIFAILAAIVIFSKALSKSVKFFEKFKNQKLTLISSIVSLLILGNFTLNADMFDKGFGFFVLWIGVIALLVYPFVYKGDKE